MTISGCVVADAIILSRVPISLSLRNSTPEIIKVKNIAINPRNDGAG